MAGEEGREGLGLHEVPAVTTVIYDTVVRALTKIYIYTENFSFQVVLTEMNYTFYWTILSFVSSWIYMYLLPFFFYFVYNLRSVIYIGF